MSDAYRDLFNRTYGFCSELVRTGQQLDRRQQRVRYWGALALLRCVMSSPAAALAALENRHDGLPAVDGEPDFSSFIFESSSDRTDDGQPTPPVEAAEAAIPENDRRELRLLGRRAASLMNSRDDSKLGRCAELVADLLREGFHPIVWCRYIATADYVAEGLQRALGRQFSDLRIVSITGSLSDDERRTKIEELADEKLRVLVATDCLSRNDSVDDA